MILSDLSLTDYSNDIIAKCVKEQERVIIEADRLGFKYLAMKYVFEYKEYQAFLTWKYKGFYSFDEITEELLNQGYEVLDLSKVKNYLKEKCNEKNDCI